MIRHATQQDFEAIVALNQAFEHFTSSMSVDRLTQLHSQAIYHRVISDGNEVQAFVLAMGPNSDYDSVNFRWFAERYDDFVYVDRIVIAQTTQGKGLGRALYDDLFMFARNNAVPSVLCEYDIKPPNKVSARFHEQFGFNEVGRQTVKNGAKIVSLQMAWV